MSNIQIRVSVDEGGPKPLEFEYRAPCPPAVGETIVFQPHEHGPKYSSSVSAVSHEVLWRTVHGPTMTYVAPVPIALVTLDPLGLKQVW